MYCPGPAGYSKEEGQRHPWPVLYCNDGQNLFGDCKTLSGNSWCVAQTAAGLITSGRLPPFLVVGLDHAGPLRSLEYTPCTPGTGPGGFRYICLMGGVVGHDCLQQPLSHHMPASLLRIACMANSMLPPLLPSEVVASDRESPFELFPCGVSSCLR